VKAIKVVAVVYISKVVAVFKAIKVVLEPIKVIVVVKGNIKAIQQR
jgi:hypothetical protein